MAPAVLLTPWETVLPGESKIGSLTANVVIDEKKVAQIVLKSLTKTLRSSLRYDKHYSRIIEQT
jgi:hypothetical protein